MTVAAADAKAGPYTGNDVASSFAFAFKVFADADIRVVEKLISTSVETDLVLTTNYTVTRNADQDNNPGGTVTYKVGGVTTALPSTKTLTIVGDFDFAQPTDIPNGGSFFAQVIENAIDRVTLLVKQMKERYDRSLKIPVSVSGVSTDLPAPQANSIPGWNAAGTALVNYIVQVGTSLVDLAAGTGATLVGAVGGAWTTVQGFINTLLGPTGSAQIGHTPAGTGAVDTTVKEQLDQMVSVFRYMTPAQIADVKARTSLVDVTAAIQAAITNSNSIYFPNGTYTISGPLQLKADLMFYGEPGSRILQKTGVSDYILSGNGANNFVMRDLEIEGNGAAGFSGIYIINSTNVTIENCKVTKTGSIGISIIACTFAKVENCTLSNNYYYGLEFRDSDGCKAIANQCVSNGDTGIATSVGGRGIMLWRSRGCYISGNRLVTNNEYGFRIYSEAADATTSYNNVISGNVFIDNTRCDFVMYDEGAPSSLVTHNVISDNVVYRTTDTAIGAVFTLQGDWNTFVNNHVVKSGAFGTDCAFNFYNASECKLIACSAKNIDVGISTSSSDNITIDQFFGNGVSAGVTILTTGIVVKNSKFIKGGVSATAVCINNALTATGKNFFEGNYISGFHTGIIVGDEAVAIYRNTTVSSTSVGISKTGNSLANQEWGDNQFDTCNQYLVSSLRKGTVFHYVAELTYPTAPAALTWNVGDRCWKQGAAIGQPIGWVCTVAGTPGTWSPMPNL